MSHALTEAATCEDAEGVIALWQACALTRPWNDPARDFARALDHPGSTIFVVRSDGAIVGSVMAGFDGHRGWVYYLAVAASHRGQGLGRALMGAAEAWLCDQGAPKIQLMVRDDNAQAIGFYHALGLERQRVVTLGRFLTSAQ